MFAMETRLNRVKAGLGPRAAEITDRSPWDWYAESLLVRPAARRVPRASPSPAEPAAPRGRLAGLGLRGRARGGQDAGRGLLDAAPRRGRHHEARLPDRPDHGRHPRRHGRGPLGAAGGRATVVPASVRAFEAPRYLAQRRRAVCLSGEEPERARGLNVDTLWADELACWQRAESTWDLAMLALRAGTNPQALITTTPRRVAVLQPHPRRGDHRPDDRYHVRQPGPPAAASSSLRSSGYMRIPGWAGRRSTPSSSRRPRASGSRGSTRPGISPSRPNTTPSTTSAARSTPARRGTRRPCFSRSATIMAWHRPA